jgi:hypothetical protein
MSKLESFLYNQIKDKSDDITIGYIKTFRSLSETSHLINERKGALFGYNVIVNVIKKINIFNFYLWKKMKIKKKHVKKYQKI